MELYSRKQTAEMLGISVKTLDELRKDHQIGYLQLRPGCKVQFTQAHIDRYLDRAECDQKHTKAGK